MKINKLGFSLVEILVVVGIISILIGISTISYTAIREKSQDARRKSDVQEIISALEQYRSNNNAYPTPDDDYGLPFGTDSLVDENDNVYMQSIPQDPLFPNKNYYYETGSGDFTLYADLEKPEPTTCLIIVPTGTCGTELECNYCYGSHGKK